jgi:hypothetical protein
LALEQEIGRGLVPFWRKAYDLIGLAFAWGNPRIAP